MIKKSPDDYPVPKLLPTDAEKVQWHSPAMWATDNIVLDGKPFTFKDRPYLVQIYMTHLAEEVVVRKAAQMGFTVWANITNLWYLKNPLINENSLYVFPTFKKASDFSQARLKPLLTQSPAFRFDNVDVDNVGLKRIAGHNWYFRGAKNEDQITEMTAGLITVDEVDELENVEIITKIKKRASAAEFKSYRYLSTPTYPEIGIDALFMDSSQAEWYIKCDNCGKEQCLDFFKNIDLKHPEKGTICSKCKAPIDRLKNGRWIHKYNHKRLGYHISQLYAPTVSVEELVEEYNNIKGEISKQIFYNMALGLPYIPKGGKISEMEIKAAGGNYNTGKLDGANDYFMGIDVGAELHWVVINQDYKVADYGTCVDFEELDHIIDEYNVFRFVIDALPETRKSKELARRFEGRGGICYYKATDSEKEIEDNMFQFNRDREVTLDTVFAYLRSRKAQLPTEAVNDPVFIEHLTNLIRVTETNARGQKVIKYMDYGKPDHYAHAMNYAFIARDSYDPPKISFI